MGNSFWLPGEPEIIEFLQRWVTPFLQKIFEAVTFFGDQYAIIIIVGFLYWGYKKDLGKRIGLYFITSLVTTVVLGNIVVRRRPYFDHEKIKCLKPRSSEGDPYDIAIQGFSFPSGHSSNAASTYAALGFTTKKKVLRVVLLLIPVIIGLSRIVLGVHYPTDVLAGWAIAALAILLISCIKNQYVIYLTVVTIGVVGCFFSKSADFFSSFGIALGCIAGFIFEEKLVRFENTKKIPGMILRTLGGLVLFVLLDKLMEVPFSEEFLSASTGLSYAVRTVRYTIACFAVIGVYPMLFGFADKKIEQRRERLNASKEI